MTDVNPVSIPCLACSSMAILTMVVVGRASYEAGRKQNDPSGTGAYLQSTGWISSGCILGLLTVAIVKFVA